MMTEVIYYRKFHMAIVMSTRICGAWTLESIPFFGLLTQNYTTKVRTSFTDCSQQTTEVFKLLFFTPNDKLIIMKFLEPKIGTQWVASLELFFLIKRVHIWECKRKDCITRYLYVLLIPWYHFQSCDRFKIYLCFYKGQ